LLDRLGAHASKALFVGDSYEMDVLGAHAAGLAAAWVRPEGMALPGDVVPLFAFPRAVDVREVIL
jgi:FMN phosphatase YigB (HAD superfamily)